MEVSDIINMEFEAKSKLHSVTIERELCTNYEMKKLLLRVFDRSIFLFFIKLKRARTHS